MNKHTSGPWAFCNDTLCQATGNYLHLGKWIDSPGLGKSTAANRRLIESAPDLLSALVAMVEAWETGEGYSDKNNQIGNARKAIEKATGEKK